ncbi:MAG: hypothetical protein H7Y42_00300 [Chitinophagaceae bacterium]|nr:hypothetical protein [Chitinophagaceae bacterium]
MKTIGAAILTMLETVFKLPRKNWIFFVPFIFGFFGALSIVIIKLTWGFVIPRLFPGAVTQGLVVKEMPWSAAVVLFLSIAYFSIIYDDGSKK